MLLSLPHPQPHLPVVLDTGGVEVRPLSGNFSLVDVSSVRGTIIPAQGPATMRNATAPLPLVLAPIEQTHSAAGHAARSERHIGDAVHNVEILLPRSAFIAGLKLREHPGPRGVYFEAPRQRVSSRLFGQECLLELPALSRAVFAAEVDGVAVLVLLDQHFVALQVLPVTLPRRGQKTKGRRAPAVWAAVLRAAGAPIGPDGPLLGLRTAHAPEQTREQQPQKPHSAESPREIPRACRRATRARGASRPGPFPCCQSLPAVNILLYCPSFFTLQTVQGATVEFSEMGHFRIL